MAVFDVLFLNLADQVLKGFGGTCVLKKVARNYDPLQGTTSLAPTVSYTVSCSPPYPYARSLIDGIAIKDGDFQLLVAAKSLAIVPDLHMTVQRDGHEYAIVRVEPINSGDANVAFVLHCRGQGGAA